MLITTRRLDLPYTYIVNAFHKQSNNNTINWHMKLFILLETNNDCNYSVQKIILRPTYR
jgi:hypothetical protein